MYLWALLRVPGRSPVQTPWDPAALSLAGVASASVLASVL